MIRKDLKEIEVPENKWYEEMTTSKAKWHATCRTALEKEQHQQQQRRHTADQPLNQLQCQTCLRTFRREGDMRHKCLSERQRTAVQCSVCHKWFAS